MWCHPLAALHVAVTEIENARIKRHLYTWHTRQNNDECRRLFLRYKMLDNKLEIENLEKIIFKSNPKNTKHFHKLVILTKELAVLYKERSNIHNKDIYYKSIHWEDS